VFEAGLRSLRELFGLEIRELPTTRWDAAALRADPAARGRDLVAALEDPEVRAVICTVGGDDAVRMLPFVDPEIVARNPKIVMGFSDVTPILLHVRRAGVVSFYGPTVMAGLAQAPSLPDAFRRHLEIFFFEGGPVEYHPYPWFADGYPDWAAGEINATLVNEHRPTSGPRFVQGSGRVRAEATGGCVGTLTFLTGTRFFPTASEVEGRFLLLETSEEKPHPRVVRRFLDSLGLQGVLERVAGLLVGRPRDYSDDERQELESYLVAAMREYGGRDAVIVTELAFGHTDPQHVLPLGVPIEVDFDRRTIRTTESSVAARGDE
jgi:muramoyltetrapeptide carboxypeptidase LdcA involved in peptidoglycan recycling